MSPSLDQNTRRLKWDTWDTWDIGGADRGTLMNSTRYLIHTDDLNSEKKEEMRHHCLEGAFYEWKRCCPTRADYGIAVSLNPCHLGWTNWEIDRWKPVKITDDNLVVIWGMTLMTLRSDMKSLRLMNRGNIAYEGFPSELLTGIPTVERLIKFLQDPEVLAVMGRLVDQNMSIPNVMVPARNQVWLSEPLVFYPTSSGRVEIESDTAETLVFNGIAIEPKGARVF